MPAKPELRKQMSGKRSAMSPDERFRASLAVQENLERLDEFREALGILFYLSLEEEVQTDDMISSVLERGGRVYVPLMDKKELRVTRIPGMNIEFEKGPYGVREPRREFWDLRDPEELDLVIVPGLAFDPMGGRIGFGAGYYDRFLSSLDRRVTFAGLAFDFQIVDVAPQSASDCRVHFIVTDQRVHDCRHPLMN